MHRPPPGEWRRILRFLTMFLKGASVFGKNRRAKFAAFGALIALGFIVLKASVMRTIPRSRRRPSASFRTDQALITIDVHSWNTDLGDDHRTNDVVLTVTAPGFNQTYNHEFNVANNFAFTQKIQVPADGKTYTATATTDESWGPNNDIIIPIGPQSRSVQVTVPQPCLPRRRSTTTTTTAPTTTLPRRPPVAPPPRRPPPPVSVQGVVETAPTHDRRDRRHRGAGCRAGPYRYQRHAVGHRWRGARAARSAVELNARRRRTA